MKAKRSNLATGGYTAGAKIAVIVAFVIAFGVLIVVVTKKGRSGMASNSEKQEHEESVRQPGSIEEVARREAPKTGGLVEPTIGELDQEQTDLDSMKDSVSTFLQRKRVDFLGRRLGRSDDETLDAKLGLAVLLREAGRDEEARTLEDEAIGLFREALELVKKESGSEHPAALSALRKLAYSYQKAARQDEALALTEELLKLRTKVLGPEHSDTLKTANAVAWALVTEGKLEKAEQIIRPVLPIMERTLGADNSLTLASADTLGECLRRQGKLSEAEIFLRQSLEGADGQLRSDNLSHHEELLHLALCLEAQGKFVEARPFAKRALEGAQSALGKDHTELVEYETLWEKLEHSEN